MNMGVILISAIAILYLISVAVVYLVTKKKADKGLGEFKDLKGAISST